MIHPNNTILPSMPGSSEWSLPFGLYDWNTVHISHFYHKALYPLPISCSCIGCSERRLIGHSFYRWNFLRKSCATCREKCRSMASRAEKSDKPAQWTPCKIPLKYNVVIIISCSNVTIRSTTNKSSKGVQQCASGLY
jgi:hypothetical protein